MEERLIFPVILLMALVTAAPRVLPVWLLANRDLPVGLQIWLRQIPTAILAALLAQSILLRESRLFLDLGNLHLWAATLAFLVAYRTKSMLWTVSAGMAGLAALRWLLGS